MTFVSGPRRPDHRRMIDSNQTTGPRLAGLLHRSQLSIELRRINCIWNSTPPVSSAGACSSPCFCGPRDRLLFSNRSRTGFSCIDAQPLLPWNTLRLTSVTPLHPYTALGQQLGVRIQDARAHLTSSLELHQARRAVHLTEHLPHETSPPSSAAAHRASLSGDSPRVSSLRRLNAASPVSPASTPFKFETLAARHEPVHGLARHIHSPVARPGTDAPGAFGSPGDDGSELSFGRHLDVDARRNHEFELQADRWERPASDLGLRLAASSHATRAALWSHSSPERRWGAW